MTAQFWDLMFLAMTMATSLFCVALIARGCLSDSRWPSHAIALIAFFVIMFAESIDGINAIAPYGTKSPQIVGFTLPLVPALGACMWFYIRGLTSTDQGFKRRDFWHMAPVVGLAFCALPFLLLPREQQQFLVPQQIDMHDPDQVTAVIFLLLGWISWLAILVLYGSASLRRLVRHRKQIRALFSNEDGVSLTWLHTLIVIVFSFTILALVGTLLPVTSGLAPLTEALAAPFYFCLVFAVGLFGVLQKSVIPTWSEIRPEENAKQKYHRSALKSNDLMRIAKKLDATMRNHTLWQNPSLSLHDLSRETGISQNNISQALNEHLGKNFYDYVNGWRIDAACIAMSETDQSVLTISLDVGFNSKSTFNAAFKKIMHQTPRHYRTNAQAQTKGANGPDRSKQIGSS